MAEKTYSYYENLLNNPRVQAALNTVSWSDGVLDHPGVKDPYGTRYGYSTFDYSGWHPNDTISKGRYTSSAVGKYQAMRYSFAPLAAELGIPNINAKNQDVFALALIDQVPGALDAALKGDARTFADKTKGLWTSLPGGSQSKSKGKGTQAVERHRQQVEKAFNAYLDKATNNPSTLGGLSMDSAAKQRAETGTGYVERRSPTEQAQAQLAGLGFNPGAINGVYGNWVGRTAGRSGRPQLNEPLRAAIGAFQSDYGLPFTQQLDQTTLDTIDAQARAQDARDARLGALPISNAQQNMARPTAPTVGGMPRNPMFPDRVTTPTPRPNVAPPVNPAEIQRMRDNLTSRMAFALPNPSNMNISGYGFSTPAKPSGPSATGSATGSIGRASATGNVAVPSRAPSVMGGRGNVNPPNVVPGPINNLPNFDQYGNFIGNRQTSAAPTSDFRSSLAERSAVPQRSISAPSPTAFAPGPTSSQSVRDAQSGLAKSNVRDQFVRDVLRTGVEVQVAPAKPSGPSVSELAKQYSQYGNRSISAPQNSSMYDMVDIPQSSTIAQQYASYGAGKIAPQVASTATQAVPVAPTQRQAVPTTVAPRSPTVAPSLASPQAINDAAKQRMDAAIPGIYQGIPKQDIYDQNAPGRSGFRGFGAGGFLGNLLTGNFGNMAGIEGGNRLPGLLGVIQGAIQGLGGPQQAAQAVQGAVPALGQVMGLPAAQQAARAGNNMVIGRDAAGRIGWMADGGLSAGALGAGWASNNPERSYGGYGGGYDPTPV